MVDATTTLEGHFLISMPGLDEGIFSRSVVYVCAHSRDGAMGLVINKPADHIHFKDVLEQLKVTSLDDGAGSLSPQAERMAVLSGGPVEAGRGFVLHSADFVNSSSTIMMEDHLALTATLDILKAVAKGQGPRDALFLLGYAGWAPGQLEQELQTNSWLSARASLDILFHTDYPLRYEAALRSLGIHPALLSAEVGHA